MTRHDRAVLWLARRVLRLASRRVAYGLLDEARRERAAVRQRGASVGNGDGPPGTTICGTVPEHWWRLV